MLARIALFDDRFVAETLSQNCVKTPVIEKSSLSY